MSGRTIARIVGLLVAAAAALSICLTVNNDRHPISTGLIVAITAASGILAFAITPFVVFPPARWVLHLIRHTEVSDLIAAAVGLLVGLVIALLASNPLSQIQFLRLGQWLPTIALVIFVAIGMTTALVRKDDFARLITANWTAGRAARRAAREDRDHDDDEREEPSRLRDRFSVKKNRGVDRILVDTSAIIDGRIADISETGFIFGTLVVPRFVLEELQHIADSADSMRRARGRRGLDILQRLQKEPAIQVEITDADAESIPEVDGKLVKLARQWHCPIVTNDFNLNRVAELQGVKVLNINELAHAVKPILLPGEEMQVKIMQEGKELNQGVGYLDDGTMIVVENGKLLMGQSVDVTVTRVLQTVAGRMIFAHPKQAPAGSAAPARRAGAS
jgi:uncharacterized protein YacL